MKQAVLINKIDNVAVALLDLSSKETIDIDGVYFQLNEDIKAGHKFSIVSIAKNSNIIKYGMPIGKALTDIGPGEWVHTHNIKTGLENSSEYIYEPAECNITLSKEEYFEGYVRKNDSVGIRNEIWIIPTVGCVNSIAKVLADSLDGTDGIIVTAFTHPYGCSQMGEDQENTRTILARMINHPNAGGVLVLGLGCENSNIEVLKPYIGEYDEERVKFLVCQDVEDEMEQGTDIIKGLIKYACSFKREKVNMNKLIVGLKCGGSDGLSGITANPLVGRFADRLVSKGGTVILTEVPEMFGAETLLMKRCINEKIFNKTVNLINGFKSYFIENGQNVYENPSPGNKKGGISTLEDKALGCTQKSGSGPVIDVLEYGESVRENGLNLLCAPGNDLVASTALAASGAQLVLFTTGRGTPFESPVPTVKISTNSELARKKSGWIDYDAGVVVWKSDFDSEENGLYEYVKEIASGKTVKAEINGFHDMAIFKKGITL